MRIAYVGAGAFTSLFIHPHLHLHEGIELAAIADLDLEKAWKAQRKYGFRNAYSDHLSMIETEKPDAVFVVGGPKVHYAVGRDVLERGFPLYIQKPPASSSAETRELADLAERKGVVCHVGYNLRFTPAVQSLKRIMQQPDFGQALQGIFRYGLASTPSMRFNVMDQHCHILDLARFIMGDIREAHVMRSDLPGARDYVLAVRFATGAVGTISLTSGQLIEKEFVYLEVTGEGALAWSHGGHELHHRRAMPHPWWKNPEPDHVYGHTGWGCDISLAEYGYVGDTANFLAAVRGEEADQSPIASTIGTIELCEEILRQMGNPD